MTREEKHVEKNVIRSGNNNSGIKSSSYKIPNRFIYTIKLDNGLLVRYQETAINSESNPEYENAKKLKVTYTFRDLPFSEPKTMVYEVEESNTLE